MERRCTRPQLLKATNLKYRPHVNMGKDADDYYEDHYEIEVL